MDANGVTFNEVTTVVFTSGPADELVFTTQPAGPYVAGAPIAAVVTVKDAQGNVVTSSSAGITMTAEPAATIFGTNPVNAANGIATFSISIHQAGTYRLRATSGGMTVLSNEITVDSASLFRGPGLHHAACDLSRDRRDRGSADGDGTGCIRQHRDGS